MSAHPIHAGADAQYQRERQRHPDQLATEVIALRRAKRALEEQLKTRNDLALCIPPDYAQALVFAYFVAHDAPVTDQETPGRKHPTSNAPGYNPAAFRLLHDEQQQMRRRAKHLRNAVAHAADHPEA